MGENDVIEEIDIDIDDIISPTASSVIIPEEKKSILSKDNSIDELLDKSFEEDPKIDEKTNEKTIEKFIDSIDSDEKKDEPENKVETSAISSLVEDGFLNYFEGEEDITKYKAEDLKDLIKANVDRMVVEETKKVAEDMFNTLPIELKQAYAYVNNGGENIKDLLKVLSNTVEIKDVDENTDEGAERIAREYMTRSKFGTPEEIEDEITDLKDRGKLTERSKKYKSKIIEEDSKNIEDRIKDEERKKDALIKESKMFQKNIYDTISTGLIGELKVGTDIQNKLYKGLISPEYTSITGKKTNLFGHLIEKYQFTEPNLNLIAETLWLLSDPEGYRKSIKDQGGIQNKVQNIKEIKNIRFDEGEREKKDDKNKGGYVVRPSRNLFKR